MSIGVGWRNGCVVKSIHCSPRNHTMASPSIMESDVLFSHAGTCANRALIKINKSFKC